MPDPKPYPNPYPNPDPHRDPNPNQVISPDPNLEIDELGVPVHIARVLTYPERVFSENLSQLRRLVLNGPDVWPGANYVESAGAGNKRSLKFGDRRRAASELKAGGPHPTPNPLTP